MAEGQENENNLIIPNQDILTEAENEPREESEEECSSCGSDDKTMPRTMADVVLLAQSRAARKKRHEEFSEVISDIPLDTSPLERIGIICVLEDCIDQLSILGKTNKKPTVSPNLKFFKLKERFAERERTMIDMAEIEGKAEVSRESKKILKLQIERANLEMILQDTLDDLKSNESFKTVAEVMILENKQRNEEQRLIREEQENRKTVANLRAALREGYKESMDVINKKHEVLAQLKDEIQDTFFMNDLKYKYVSHWEKAREEQNLIRLNTAEDKYENNLTEIKDNIDLEERCHVEVEEYIREAISKLEKSIEKWKERYKNELEDRTDEIQRLKAKRAEHYSELEELVRTHQQRRNEIDAYLAYKEKVAAEKAHEDFLNNTATRIQAWWRGTMVRRGLGPFKKTKKGKDKKVKGKKKK